VMRELRMGGTDLLFLSLFLPLLLLPVVI
jgi:hypothetical protein